LVAGYHLIFSTYGLWLPNDPRGSWSDFIGSWDLYRYGGATKPRERRSLARDAHDARLRLATKQALRCPPVEFNGVQARAVACGSSCYLATKTVPVWPCVILPDRVHLVVGRSDMSVEQLVIQLKASAIRPLERECVHPLASFKREGERVPSYSVQGQWKVYLDPPDIPRAITYVQNNPLKEHKRRQAWSFVTEYDTR
jgi:REP element-mobilizing transposase RayT